MDSHVTHNAFKAGSKATEWCIEDILRNVFYLFHDTPARREDFISVTGSSCETRWVENVPCAEQLVTIWPNIEIYIKAVKDKKIPGPKSKPYATVQKASEDPLFLAKLNVFITIAKDIHPFLTKYQTDNVMIPFLCHIFLQLSLEF